MSELTKLLLLGINWFREKEPSIPLSQAFLISQIRQKLIDTSKLDIKVRNLPHTTPSMDIIQEIVQINPEFLAWGVYIWNESKTHEILRILKQIQFKGNIILGGPQITYSDDLTLKTYPYVNYFIRGEGETPIVGLINQLLKNTELINLPHGIMKKDCYNNNQIFIESDLNNLCSPYLSGDYPIFPFQRFIRWQTSRGCPYSCSYCCHRLTTGVRYFSLERLRREIDLFIQRNVQEIMVIDPIFNLKPNHYEPIIQYMIEKSLKSRLELQCRLELVKSNFLDFCEELNVHLEFGLQTINQKENLVINRKNKWKTIDIVLHELQTRKISYEVHLIYGLPFQTRKSLIKSINYLVNLQIPQICLFPLVLLRGSALFKKKDELRLISIQSFPHYVISHPIFDINDWIWASRLSEYIKNSYNTLEDKPSVDDFWRELESTTSLDSNKYSESETYVKTYQLDREKTYGS